MMVFNVDQEHKWRTVFGQINIQILVKSESGNGFFRNILLNILKKS